MMYVGIDLGLDGGIAVLDDTLQPLALVSMPTRLDPHGKRDINVMSLADLFNKLSIIPPTSYICMEYVHSFGQEARSAIFSFGRGTGKVQAFLDLFSLPRHEVLPQQWKEVILHGTDKSKQAAIGYAINRWPVVESILRKSDRKRPAYHDGMADAICLAEFAYRHHKGEVR